MEEHLIQFNLKSLILRNQALNYARFMMPPIRLVQLSVDQFLQGPDFFQLEIDLLNKLVCLLVLLLHCSAPFIQSSPR